MHMGCSELYADLRSRQYEDVLLVNRPQDRRITKTWFEAELSGLPKHAHVVNFTVKFRVATSKGWRWIKDTTGVQDGEFSFVS
jgi:hypothetical protein